MFLDEIVKNPKILSISRQNTYQNFNKYIKNSQEEDDEEELDEKFNGSGCQQLFLYLGEKFSRKTSIHGVERLFSRNRGRKERILWTIAFLFALLILIYVFLLIAARYNRKQFKTVIDSTRFPTYKIPFPELTICNRNRLNWNRLEDAKRRFLQKHHLNEDHEALFTKVVAQFDTLTFGKFDQFAFLTKYPLQDLNYVNFTEVVRFMSWQCNEIFEDCGWHYQKYNCCDILFPRKSQMGMCLAFNSIEAPEAKQKKLQDSMWPWRMGKYGPGSALTLKILIREKQHYPMNLNDKGIMFMSTEPHAWYSIPELVAAKTRTSVSINTIVHFHDDLTKSVSPEERECLFENEHNFKKYVTLPDHSYMLENCQSECQQQYLLRFCNCTMDVFFPSGSFRTCQLTDFPCLAKYNERFTSFARVGEEEFVASDVTGMECKCLHNCFYLTYINDVRSSVLKDEEQRRGNSTVIEMDFYFRRNFILAYRTTMVFTWVDLLVSFGGVAGLFLGCSLISIVELFYFMLVDMPKSVNLEHTPLHETGKRIQMRMKKLSQAENRY